MEPLEFIYYLGYSLKKSRSLKKQKKLPFRVISVGNMTVGGTGKTPAVIALAQEALKRGIYPVILTRGYRGNAKGPCFVSKGSGPLLSVDEAGDEPFLMAELLADVPIVKCADRYAGGIFAIKELSNQQSAISNQQLLFILDDGFQHWRLYRDLDILLIDSTNPFGNRKLLPAGVLREPLKELARADVVVLTKTTFNQGSDKTSLIKEITKLNQAASIFFAGHKPICLRTLAGEELPLDTVSGKSVMGFCGIGSPGSFKNSLLALNANVKEFMVFRDHFNYAPEELSRIKDAARKNKADWIVTTEKDIIRLKEFKLPEQLLALVIRFDTGEEFYDRIFSEA